MLPAAALRIITHLEAKQKTEETAAKSHDTSTAAAAAAAAEMPQGLYSRPPENISPTYFCLANRIATDLEHTSCCLES